ncbi:Ger(x)C family spore germination protein [Paenibacillus sp. 2TAB23]|uniref:Ger(x)C family spore germination protein n=1 Tax=Paenibacillus sp. 2TAB23 TaxID=3233004 RepID=UPI003F95A767
MLSWWIMLRRQKVKRTALLGVLLSSLLLQGCWDEINLEDVSYISSLGIDFKEGHYEVYAQMIKFGLIAKTESIQPDPNPVWIGKGKGDSILLAFNDLTKAGQAILSLEHLKSVIVQERAMTHMEDIMDGLNRQRASRYTSILFGTKSPIEDLFTTDTFFDQSPLNSIMYMPSPLNVQRSFIRPHALQLAVQSLNEPAMTTTVPSLSANKDYWKRKKQPLKIQFIDGVFVYREFRYIGFMTEPEAEGLRWINPEFEHFLFGVKVNDGTATVTVTSSKAKINASFKDGVPHFMLAVRMAGDMAEMQVGMKQSQIETEMAAKTQRQLLETYRKGLAKGMDVFGLEHHLYRYHNAYWKQHCKGKNWMPKEGQLQFKTTFQLIHSGNFELNSDT